MMTNLTTTLQPPNHVARRSISPADPRFRPHDYRKTLKKFERLQGLIDTLMERTQTHLVHFESDAKVHVAREVNRILEQFSRKNYSIRVNDNFEFYMITDDGRIVAKSTGENLLLNLSFVSALIGLARTRQGASGDLLIKGTIAPFVIDAPFGELDESYKSVTVEILPRTVDQLVLLLSSSHWKGTVDQSLTGKIGREYVLVSEQTISRGSRPEDVIQVRGRNIVQSRYGQKQSATRIEEV